MKNESTLLTVESLIFSFHTYAGEVQAVRGVSFQLEKGQTLGIVGESGCGKSVTAKSIVRLNPDKPSGEIKNGRILFDGKKYYRIDRKRNAKDPGKRDPYDFSGSNDKPESYDDDRETDCGRDYQKWCLIQGRGKKNSNQSAYNGRDSKPGRTV